MNLLCALPHSLSQRAMPSRAAVRFVAATSAVYAQPATMSFNAATALEPQLPFNPSAPVPVFATNTTNGTATQSWFATASDVDDMAAVSDADNMAAVTGALQTPEGSGGRRLRHIFLPGERALQ